MNAAGMVRLRRASHEWVDAMFDALAEGTVVVAGGTLAVREASPQKAEVTATSPREVGEAASRKGKGKAGVSRAVEQARQATEEVRVSCLRTPGELALVVNMAPEMAGRLGWERGSRVVVDGPDGRGRMVVRGARAGERGYKLYCLWATRRLSVVLPGARYGLAVPHRSTVASHELDLDGGRLVVTAPTWLWGHGAAGNGGEVATSPREAGEREVVVEESRVLCHGCLKRVGTKRCSLCGEVLCGMCRAFHHHEVPIGGTRSDAETRA